MIMDRARKGKNRRQRKEKATPGDGGVNGGYGHNEHSADFIIHCWLSSSAPTARPSYVMPGGGKKAVFPPLNLHDHDQVRISTNDQDRQKKLLQSRGRSLELKEALDKEKSDGPKNKKSMASSSKSVEKSPNGKTDQQKTPTKSEQKALLKLEQQQIKSEQKAQQKLEKEQQKLEKEHQKEQLKLEKEHQKEQQKLEKEQKSKIGFRSKQAEYFSSLRENPQLKTQKSIDLSCLKHQKSMESPRHPARKSVDMQYRQDLVDPSDFSNALSSMNLKPKK